MRDIKYRGIAEHSGVMIFGFYTQGCFDGISKSVPHGISQAGCYPVSVIKKTVGQLTGMKDCAGIDIYEGDICFLIDTEYQNEQYEVAYSDSQCKFYLKDNAGRLHGFMDDYDLKVIGNIHENPELMGGC